MARINIEDSFWLEVMDMAVAMGSQDLAIGNAVRFFRFAQECAKTGKYISEAEFKSKGFSEALFQSFAKRNEQGIQAVGAEKHFGWLAKRIEAGRKGGSKRKQNQANESKVEQTEPSSSSSSSFSSSSSNSISDSSLVAVAPASGAPAIKNPDLNRKIWKAYSEAYLVRYHKDPVRNAKVNGQVAQLGSRLGEEAPDVAAFYLTANKTFYVAKCHEFGLCLSDAEALHTQWFHGKAITNSDLKRFEKTVESHDLDQLINEGKI